MQPLLLDKTALDRFLHFLSRDFKVFIPSIRNGICNFRIYTEGKAPFKKIHTQLPVKTFFLPQKELMFRYRKHPADDSPGQLQEVLPEDKVVVFGVSPCDARALLLTALVFLDDSANSPKTDPYFQKRMEHAILIGWGCDRPCSTCFCHGVGGHPFGEEGLDIILTDLGEKLMVKPLTARGEKIIHLFDMPPADAESIATAAEIARKALDSMPPGLKLGQPLGQNLNKLFELPLWEETARRCLNCGICTYLCPTCWCFDMLDRTSDGEGARFRIWDSCMFALFTLHANGLNPRPTKRERLRQRFMHKLKYFPELYSGKVGCVGCGRCIVYCPVNIDIREIAARMFVR